MLQNPRKFQEPEASGSSKEGEGGGGVQVGLEKVDALKDHVRSN